MSRFSPRFCVSKKTLNSGFTLVEMVVALFIIAIVMMGWSRITNATSPYREAQRLAVVEIAAGMLDIFQTDANNIQPNQFFEGKADGSFDKLTNTRSDRQRLPVEWLPLDAYAYYYTLATLKFTGNNETDVRKWSNGCMWIEIKVFENADTATQPFVTFSQLLEGDMAD